METSKTSLKPTYEWNNIPWAKVQRVVFKLQKRIYQAVKSGQKAKARNLQKLLLKSYYAKLLAVRKVTQDNAGKKTAGVDGVKSLTPPQRLKLVAEMGNRYKAKPLRRVWIPKPGRDEKRPLGIPTMRDRARQALVKITLEPYWESQFEGTSYGFRPGRSAHDAIARIFITVNQVPRWILDADITKCFDEINHDYLLSKLDSPASIRREVKQWLNAGVMDKGLFENTEAGTPQGGVISPLLANIALDGMIREITAIYPRKLGFAPPVIIRYADDFVVIHKDLEIIQQCKIAIQEWLKPVGLELKPEKTKICHTLEGDNPGFDFLGFNIRSYPVGKHHSGKNSQKELLGFKTLIKPSKKAIKAHHDSIKEVIDSNKHSPQYALITRLNPIIRGWCNYYRGVVSGGIFSSEDMILWKQLRAWTSLRTGKANYKKLNKYFRNGKNGAWTFQTKEGLRLLSHHETSIKRHTLIRPDKSPYDGDWIYWSKRTGKSLDVPGRVAILLKKQKGKCNHCGLYFNESDHMEVDHIIPRSLGGKDEYNNLQLLHKHCHDLKTASDGSLDNRTHEKG